MILKESKGYHLEMRAMKRHFELKYATLQDKCDFYIEGLERGLNETKLYYQQEINRLLMQKEDLDSELYRIS